MEWYGDEFLKETDAAFANGLASAGEFAVSQIRQSISVSSHGLSVEKTATGHFSRVHYAANRSLPGQPPHVDTGALISSMTYEIDPENLQVLIGSPLEYALYLELGTRIMAPRPFLRRGLADNAVQIVQIATGGEYQT